MSDNPGTPAKYLESYPGQRLIMVHRADLEAWAKDSEIITNQTALKEQAAQIDAAGIAFKELLAKRAAEIERLKSKLGESHYLCERCGGTGQQPDGCYSMETKKYDEPAGTCTSCDGVGYLGCRLQSELAALRKVVDAVEQRKERSFAVSAFDGPVDSELAAYRQQFPR